MKKVFIAGTFDIIHPGHLNMIKQAGALGDYLIIVIARDKNVLKAKGRLPFYDEKKRKERLESYFSKNSKLPVKILLGDLDDPYKIIKEEKPDIVALGYDQKFFVPGLIAMATHNHYHFKIEMLEPFKENYCKSKNIRKIYEDKQAGFLLINKPVDWTSHDVVAKLRSITKIKQIGHAGTLDPFATGLLICAIGQATKMIDLFHLLPKEYEAEIKLGVVSDTYDRAGKITNYNSQDTKKFQITKSNIQTILKSFSGKQKQLPPMFSAKKVGGKKLYELARQGQEIERQTSNIEIFSISLLKLHDSSFTLHVKCSAGTYIRTLAHDLGQKLGTGALLQELKRTAIGDFDLEQAVDLENLTSDNYSEFLISPAQALEILNLNYAARG